MTDTMRVRLHWRDGRVEDVARIPEGTTQIVRTGAAGHRHFLASGAVDEEGFAVFVEEENGDNEVA
jgi:hypothetical protein